MQLQKTGTGGKGGTPSKTSVRQRDDCNTHKNYFEKNARKNPSAWEVHGDLRRGPTIFRNGEKHEALLKKHGDLKKETTTATGNHYFFKKRDTVFHSALGRLMLLMKKNRTV